MKVDCGRSYFRASVINAQSNAKYSCLFLYKSLFIKYLLKSIYFPREERIGLSRLGPHGAVSRQYRHFAGLTIHSHSVSIVDLVHDIFTTNNGWKTKFACNDGCVGQDAAIFCDDGANLG